MSSNLECVRDALDGILDILESADEQKFLTSEHRDEILGEYDSLAQEHGEFMDLQRDGVATGVQSHAAGDLPSLLQRCNLLKYKSEQLLRADRISSRIRSFQSSSDEVVFKGTRPPAHDEERNTEDDKSSMKADRVAPTDDSIVANPSGSPTSADIPRGKEAPMASRLEPARPTVSPQGQPGPSPHATSPAASHMSTFEQFQNDMFPGNVGHEYAFEAQMFGGNFPNLAQMMNDASRGDGLTVNVGSDGASGAYIHKVQTMPIFFDAQQP